MNIESHLETWGKESVILHSATLVEVGHIVKVWNRCWMMLSMKNEQNRKVKGGYTCRMEYVAQTKQTPTTRVTPQWPFPPKSHPPFEFSILKHETAHNDGINPPLTGYRYHSIGSSKCRYVAFKNTPFRLPNLMN